MSNPKTNLFTANLQGNIGSQTCFHIDNFLSHMIKLAYKRPDRIKLVMTVPLSQGYATPPCCSAKTSRMDATSDNNAPTISMRFHARFSIIEWKK